MNACIIVHGASSSSAETKAKAIAHYYGVQCRPIPKDPTSWEVDASKKLEQDICMSDDACLEALNNINAAENVAITIDDLEF